MPPYCMPPVTGVPGHGTTKLNWWAPGSRPHENYPEDPNWLGAFSLGDGSGTQNQVQFRALSGTDAGASYLYLSWLVRVQPNPVAINQDGLSILVGDGTNYVALRVRLSTAFTVINGDETVAFDVKSHPYSTGGGLGGVHGVTVPWATQTARAWIGYASPISTVPGTIPWAFQLRVPLGVNLAAVGDPAVVLPLNNQFKLWYEVNVWLAATASVVKYPWPGTPPSTSSINFIPAGLTPPDVALPGTPAGCASGITLPRSQIAVQDIVSGASAVRTTIQLDLTGSPPDVTQPQHQNMFFARPSGVGVNTSGLRARFRLGNWGTQFPVPTPDSWKIVPGGNDLQYQAPAAPYTSSEFRFVWPQPPLDAFTTDFIDGVKLFNSTGGASGRNPHQCMMVEMWSTLTSDVFAQSSEFNNLWAADASTFRDVAEVSVVGNPPIGPGPRDIYLYVQARGLPRVVGNTDAGTTGPGFGDDQQIAYLGLVQQTAEPAPGTVFDHQPTYLVHAYYDTGQKLEREDGTFVPILRPQTSFGYVVRHQGPVVGWETRLYGAERIAENVYVIRVPNNGTRRIRIAIQARESQNERPLPVQESWCTRKAFELEARGKRLLARIVRLLCRLLGHA